MSSTVTQDTAVERSSPAAPAGGRERAAVARREASELVTPQGRTSIADAVVRKIAGVATRQVPGVHDLGSGGARVVGTFRQHLPGSSGRSVTQGVAVEVGQRQAAVDLDIVVEYGVPIVDLSHAVRRNVIMSVEEMTGLEVTEVNIAVDDIHIEEDGERERVRAE